VKACNSHNYWSEPNASFAFSLAPHVYETWPFYGACALAVIGVAGGIQYSRLRGLRKILALQQQAALERERARIAQDMHDDLGASLTKIAILSEIAKQEIETKERAGAEVAQIAATARTVVDNISELVWATNPKNDTLDNLVAYLREHTACYFDDTPIQCRLAFPENVPTLPINAETRRGIFLVVKEALHNIVKHSGATKVEVRVGVKRSTLNVQRSTFDAAERIDKTDTGEVDGVEISIADNGRGFDPAAVSRFSNGLQNMRQRVVQLGGTFDLESQPGAGTHIKIAVDLRSGAG